MIDFSFSFFSFFFFSSFFLLTDVSSDSGEAYSDSVDSCTASSCTLAANTLVKPKHSMAAAYAGGMFFFAGGISQDGYEDVVEVWKLTGTTVTFNTTFLLPQAVVGFASISLSNVVIFAGGEYVFPFSSLQ